MIMDEEHKRRLDECHARGRNFDHVRYQVNPIAFMGLRKSTDHKLQVAINNVLKKRYKMLQYDTFISLAEFYKVNPEYFVDERYYYKRCLYAPYRIVFYAKKLRNETPEQFWTAFKTWYDTQIGRRRRSIGREYFGATIRGTRLRQNGEQINGYTIYYAIYMCLFLGIPPGEVFVLFRDQNDTVFSELHNDIQRLSNPDIAVLASIARAMALYTPEEKPELLKTIGKMLDLREEKVMT